MRRRRIRIAFFGMVPLRLQAWHLLYRTTDLHGAPETTVTTVLAPRDARETSRSWPISAPSMRCLHEPSPPMGCFPERSASTRLRTS